MKLVRDNISLPEGLSRGEDPFKTMKVGRDKDIEVGDEVYIKPNALSLDAQSISPSAGYTREHRNWRDAIAGMGTDIPYRVSRVYGSLKENSRVVLDRPDDVAMDLPMYMVSPVPNDDSIPEGYKKADGW